MKVSVLCILQTLYLATNANELARGWGDAIAWTDLNTGLVQAKAQDKHVMLLIHKSWCGACKQLKPLFASSQEIADLSNSFIMVNTLDDEEPKDQKYAPDGGYIPRIFFLTPDGDVRNDIYNKKGLAEYKYYYSNPESIVESMKQVIETEENENVLEEL